MTKSLRKRTVTALIWSACQSWGTKLLALVVFFVMARYLTPAEMGLAQTVILILAFIAIISEQGFQDAIVQRQNLTQEDLNLPFAVSMATAFAASGALVMFSTEIAQALRAEAAAPLIVAAAIIPPITAATIFEIAMRRRQLDFKMLAYASLIAGLLSGIVALVMATNGYGATSLIAQAIVAAIVTSIVLWRKPLWKPGWKFTTDSFKGLLAYSTSAFGSRLLDFFSGKIIDLTILSRFGLSSLGIFTVGAKLYLTILQLLASTLIDVALSAMSQISSDTERLRNAYLRFIFLASCTTSPLFVGVAVLAPEICLILFGEQWPEAEKVTRLLCLLGAVQVIQFFNSSAIGAIGNSKQILFINLLKFAMCISAVSLFQASSISDVTIYYVLAQLIVTPVSFFLGMKATKTSLYVVVASCIPGIVSSALAFSVVLAARDSIYAHASHLFVATSALGLLFLLTYCIALAAVGGKRLAIEYRFFTQSHGATKS